MEELPKQRERAIMGKLKKDFEVKDLLGLATIKTGIISTCFYLIIFAGIFFSGKSGELNHRYRVGDQVPIYANKIGPYNNPSETYRYFDLPFCSPDHLQDKNAAFGEYLNGDRLVSTPHRLLFQKNTESIIVCKKKLTTEEVAKFRNAVKNDYYFQMFIDDLPVWGFIGSTKMHRTQSGIDNEGYDYEYRYFVYNSSHFEIFYNEDRVIQIIHRADQNERVDVTDAKEIEVAFTSTVEWKETNTTFESRLEVYSQSSHLPHLMEIQWFSITNSCITILLICGFVGVRALKNHFLKYTKDEESAEDQEETGWTCIHGDVFRYPKYKSLLAAAVGSGTQLLILAIFILILGLVGVFYPYSRGALYTAMVVIYALTSGIAGYTAASFYGQLGGKNWVKNLLLTGWIFSGPLCVTFFFLNAVANYYSATAALPNSTIFVIFLIWVMVASPLLVLGGIAGKNSKTEFEAPCRTNEIPREIPSRRWYRGFLPQMAMAGILPFSAICIEFYYVLASLWGLKIYTIYSILFIVFIILLIITALVTIGLTYFQLAAEDHKWWWRAFLCGGSTGFFMYCYCFYYYYERTAMSGFMQTSFFFGYMACICYGFFLMLGTIGFRAALLFVRDIYRGIKLE